MPDALELLKTRRSIKPIELDGPAPSAADIETILTIASRVPDHGKLVPWRFIVFEGEARFAAGGAIVAACRESLRAIRVDRRQRDGKRRSLAGLAFDVNRASMQAHDPPALGQTHPQSSAGGAPGKERIEQAPAQALIGRLKPSVDSD